MLSPVVVNIIKLLPEGLVIKVANRIVDGYIKKYANLTVNGIENIDEVKKPRIFVCNHLSNSDGLVLERVLKEKSDPYFIAGVKLSDDPITSLGTKIVKNIPIKPSSADKDAITKVVKTLKGGNDILIFPEGTRSRTGQMIEGKKGILLFARMAKAEIIPIGMSGTDKLLPISKDGNMGSEKWQNSDVTINIGKKVEFPPREKQEDRHEYEDKCMDILMRSIAKLLPENYRGVYK
ncbi:lysophospholipid acyltransferase family protein [Clostridium saccharobutylicum]|uniref:Glycerol-3-phosphate O-acyltransferase PlsD n=1 Tax=Clostridium saccharobutylicum DSM 13864 TaxID=1345695 RepID=U5MWV7_CLOSA|nr:lysophospholipid acyltransferase family protein [Clostridium saccharobutylicum]AGX45013.1 glycerol-3-phosphate O-acyltransferase PlsD [Clostridium saccharobutylicum DSM 13864]AQR92294.1 bifunctional protein Aas [Clostridium saccharobutylicum]AQS02196.1 bifunctional protein Aas [Clostridium saccharobutylicum]AQS11800.1 bifunctional protein Aas [Clostridium saccharobutylicum]AQS16179.1 bifunctional protein Aas [Clostridium saccharobutylicum]